MKILLIEDSLFLRLAIEKVLQKSGHEITSAADGLAGLHIARTTPPHLILLDMMLPSLDGTTVLRHLKQNSLTAEIPVVVLSSLTQKNEEKLMKAGAAAFIEKAALNLDKNSDALVQLLERVADKRIAEPLSL
jgi:CheY-like chemotaxis protein